MLLIQAFQLPENVICNRIFTQHLICICVNAVSFYRHRSGVRLNNFVYGFYASIWIWFWEAKKILRITDTSVAKRSGIINWHFKKLIIRSLRILPSSTICIRRGQMTSNSPHSNAVLGQPAIIQGVFGICQFLLGIIVSREDVRDRRINKFLIMII